MSAEPKRRGCIKRKPSPWNGKLPDEDFAEGVKRVPGSAKFLDRSDRYVYALQESGELPYVDFAGSRVTPVVYLKRIANGRRWDGSPAKEKTPGGCVAEGLESSKGLTDAQ